MGTCERINCGYYWKEEWEDFPSCKFHGFGPAPCEVDDEYGEDEEDDPCIGCSHEGFGSEHCAAGIGDYCRAGKCIIEE